MIAIVFEFFIWCRILILPNIKAEFEDYISKEINKRITCGWKKYWSLKEIVKSKDLNMHIKRKIFNTCILPCMTYGCESWALTDNQRESPASTQTAMERSMLGTRLSDKIRNSEIRRKTKVADIITRIEHLKWGWTGYMLRCKINKWSKQVPYLTRGYLMVPKRGHQKVAEDRAQWRELEEAFARRHAELRDIL
ncbi:unnamed protein product [Euphydryas editha]|uniref:Endonuclease-reverse transcriptase n=1 Tax=Euphydryas editha TaxID=104508 RepID=A0AAU9U9L7_EUPED|nr:unnamed protein product [Euphydryas editha]